MSLSLKGRPQQATMMKIKARVAQRKMSSSGERRLWMPAEDQLLKAAVDRSYQQFSRLDWTFIADNVPGRDRKACRKRYHQPSCAPGISSGRWQPEEDERLLQGVERHGSHSWTKVASVVGSRNGDQCLKRWTNYLNPTIQHSAWSDHEDRTLIMAVQQCGRDWARIASVHFPHRSPLSLRHRDQLLRNRVMSANSRGTTPDFSQGSDSMMIKQEVDVKAGFPQDMYNMAGPARSSRSSSVTSAAFQQPAYTTSYAYGMPSTAGPYSSSALCGGEYASTSSPPLPRLPAASMPLNQHIPWGMHGQEGWWGWLDGQQRERGPSS